MSKKKAKIEAETLSEVSVSSPIPKPTDPLVDSIPRTPYVPTLPDGLRFRYFDPLQAEFFARLVTKHTGDFVAALEEMRPGFTPADYAEYAYELKQKVHIKNALIKVYESIGIGEDALKLYFGKLWRLTIEEPDTKAGQLALNILSRAFGIGDIADESRKPAELKIKGHDEGVKRLLSNDDATQAANGFDKISKDKPEANLADYE